MAKSNKSDNTKDHLSEGSTPTNDEVRKLLEENVQNENTSIPKEQLSIEEELKPSKSSAILAIIAGILIILAGWSIFNYFTNKESGDITTNDNASENMAEIKPEDQDKIATLDYQGIIPVVDEVLEKVDLKTKPVEPANDQDSSIVDNSKDTKIVTFNKYTTIEKQSNTNDMNKESNPNPAVTDNSTSSNSGTWIANDYEKGDISGTTYTVVSGDTLWEISEAVYGTGTSWHQIADANNVSYLSNGNPLIIPGQVLTLP